MKQALLYLKSILINNFLVLIIIGSWQHAYSQSPCGPTVPAFTINLTGNPDSVWYSPNIPRNGQCCSASAPSQCIYFNLTLDPNVAGIQIDMIGADPSGSLFYDIGCAGSYPGGTIKCISGVGPHKITFCKPGGNKNVYIITSVSKPLFPKDDTIRIGCRKKLNSYGILKGTAVWAAISGTSAAQNAYFNTFLDSTNVASPTYSPASNAPAYIDYKVCGYPTASACGFSLTVCDTVRIYNFPTLTGTVTPNPAYFCNTGPGSGAPLTASASGGQPSYSFTWFTNANVYLGSGVSYTATATGSYKLKIKDRLYDSINCPATIIPISVQAGTTPTVNAMASIKVCASSPSVALSGTVLSAPNVMWTGGAGTYIPGNTYSNTVYYATPAEVSAGKVKLYLHSVGAGYGCSDKKDSLWVYFSSPLTASISTGTLACYNSTTTLVASHSGGTAPYTYLWSTGAITSSIAGGQGSYGVIVSDSIGCKSTNPNVNIIAPPALAITFGVTNVTVNGGTNGSATVNVTGGTPAYSATWTPGGMNTLSISGLSYGVYSVYIKDANGCDISGSTIVNEPRCLAFTANATATNVLCHGDANGIATVTVSGGIPAYTYTWNTIPVQNAATAINLNAGVYSVLIGDSNSPKCYQTANVVITEPTQLLNVMTHTDVTTIGGNNGAAGSNPFNGTAPYTYSWSTGATTSSITNLFAGSYTVNIKDNNGCTKSDSIKVTQPPCNGLTINVLTNNILCYGGNNGSAIAVVGGAVGAYTVSWSNGTFGPAVTGLSAGNYSVLVTTSQCSEFLNFTVTQPSQLSVGLLPTNVSCTGFANGSINLTVSGGTFPYLYAWSNGFSSEDLSNLSPGTYSVQIKDANGCTSIASAIITEPNTLTVTAISSQSVSCVNGNNGSAALTINGGIAPYTYTWSTGATTSSITGLSGGGYTVSVKDANGCAASPSVIVIGIQSPDSVKVGTYSVSCSVPGTGLTQVYTTPIGGVGSYSVSYNGGPYITASTPTLLTNGATYTITAKDLNGCISLLSQTLSILNEVKIDSVKFVKCYAIGTTSTNVTVYPSGGATGSYSVSFNNGTSYLAGGIYTSNLAVGNSYSVIIKDSRGCASSTMVISLPTVLNGTTSVTSNYNGQNISCFGLTDGTALSTPSGGTGPYTYSWSTIPTQTISAANNLGATTYSVIIKDANNCSITNTITLTEPTAVTSTAVVTSNYNGQNISCFGYSDGTASVTPNGGTAPYTYAWNSLPTQTNAIATGLSAGTYSVIVKDINNCSYTSTVMLTQPASITSTLAVTSNYNGQNVTCFGATNGSITAVASNGTSPFTYTWSTTPVQTGTIATGVGAGTYSVIITDANGCNYTRTINVSQPNQVAATTSITSNYNGQNVSCFGSADGSSSVTVTGGTSPFTYSWTTVPSQTTATALGLNAGTYSVTVTDINGCNITSTVTIAQPTQLDAQIFSLSNFAGFNISCYGAANGYADITVNGGTGVYTYSWSNSATTQDLTGLTAGNYSLVVTDVNGCKDTLNVPLTQPNQLVVTIDSLSNYNGYNVSCFGSNNGIVYISVMGGVTNYTYTWSNNTANQNLTNVGAGTYSLLVTDQNKCIVNIDTTLSQPPAITFSSSVTQPLCNGVSNGFIDITVGGGVTPFTYNWSNSTTNEDLGGLPAGTYTVVYTDKNGCKDSSAITVNQPQAITLAKKTDGLKCYGDTIGNISLTINGGTNPYTYAWSNGATTSSITSVNSGTYIVTVTDANGCTLKDTTKLSQPDSLHLILSSPVLFSGYNVSTYNGSDGSVNLNVTGGTSPYTFLWSNGSTSQNISNLVHGSYFVTVTDTNGCRIAGEITLTQPLILEMPQGISPNSDGKNDFFVIHGIESFPDNVLTIYNRWGNIVYSKTGYFNEWDGVSNNGQLLPDATYFAILEVNKGEIVLKGYVELRR